MFQYDYTLIQKTLLELGVYWDLPYEDEYQKGLSIDIEISDSNILSSDVSLIITGKSILAKESTEVVLQNIKEIKDSLSLARTQES